MIRFKGSKNKRKRLARKVGLKKQKKTLYLKFARGFNGAMKV
jgi:hypothetical protein